MAQFHFQPPLAEDIHRTNASNLHTDMAEILRGPDFPDDQRVFADYIPLLGLLPRPTTHPGKSTEDIAESYNATIEQTRRDLERLRDEFSEVIEGEEADDRVWWRDEPDGETFDWEEYLEHLDEGSPGLAEMYRARQRVVGEDCPTCGETIEDFETYVNGEFVTVQPCDHFIERSDIARPSDYM